MKRASETKQQFYLQERQLIVAIANDESAIFKRPASGVIEQHLLNSMLPQNRAAATYVRMVYDDAAPNLEYAFEAVFSYLAAGINWEANETNARPLVSLYHELSVCSAPPTGKELEWEYTASQLDSIATKLEHESEKHPDKSFDLKKEARYVRELIDIIEKNPDYIRFTSLTGVLLSNWELLVNFTRTYRLLSAIAKMQRGIQNTAQSRCEFVRILKEISQEWKD